MLPGLTWKTVVFYDTANGGGAVGEENAAVFNLEGLAAINLDTGGRPGRPGSGGEAFNVIIAL